MKWTFLFYGFILLFFFPAWNQLRSQDYKLIKSIPVEANGSWDYLTVDKPTQRLFFSHGTVVQVMDLKTGKITGEIANTPGVHGIAIVNEFGKGFISAGRIDSVIVFDLATLKTTGKIPTGINPDAIIYDPYSKRVFSYNGKGNNITVIDAKTDAFIGSIDLPGKPEYSVSDGKGKIFVNIEDKSVIIKFDAKTLKTDATWPLDPGKEPTGLAFDEKNNRLFSACSESSLLVVMDALSGKVITSLPIGNGCDGAVFIPEDQNIVTSNGEGTITVIHQKDALHYEVIQTLPTKKSARTITYNEIDKTIYLPAAEVTITDGKRTMTPGSFRILAVSK